MFVMFVLFSCISLVACLSLFVRLFVCFLFGLFWLVGSVCLIVGLLDV